MSTAHRLPLPLRALNAAGRLARAAGLPLLELDPEALLDAAAAQSGLSDFGDERFREPLRRLFESYERDAGLTAFGRLVVRRDTLRLLENRLHLQDAWTRHPEILAGEIRAPLFVLGLPRTGTSILHELLAQDPAEPRADDLGGAAHLAAARARDASRATRASPRPRSTSPASTSVLPEFRKIHRMGARLPQECVALTCHDFATLVFHTSHRVTSYQRWLDGADLRFVYESHRRQLQYLQWRCPAERWVLKSPGHLWALDALLDVYPDARIVQTHRDPLRVLASLAHLVTVLRGLASDRIDPFEIGADWSAAARRRARRAPSRCGARGALPEGAGLRHPVRRVRRQRNRDDPAALRPLRLSSSPPRRRMRMRRYLAANPKDGAGAHRYRLAEAGLDPAAERRRLRDLPGALPRARRAAPVRVRAPAFAARADVQKRMRYAQRPTLLLLFLGLDARRTRRRHGLDARIVNGNLSFADPSVGALLFGSATDQAMLYCSGTLVGCSTFVTAAHCVCYLDGAACQSGASAPDPGEYHVFLQHAGFVPVQSIASRPATTSRRTTSPSCGSPPRSPASRRAPSSAWSPRSGATARSSATASAPAARTTTG